MPRLPFTKAHDTATYTNSHAHAHALTPAPAHHQPLTTQMARTCSGHQLDAPAEANGVLKA
jgi:hypothetical protein